MLDTTRARCNFRSSIVLAGSAIQIEGEGRGKVDLIRPLRRRCVDGGDTCLGSVHRKKLVETAVQNHCRGEPSEKVLVDLTSYLGDPRAEAPVTGVR